MSDGVMQLKTTAMDTAANPAPLTVVDSRADGRSRTVRLSPDRITIDRRYRGVAMRVSVPVHAYQGVSVGIRPAETGGVTYELRLTHRDADLSVSLAEAPDDRSIWADWQSWARFFGLPTLIERNEGLVEWGHAPARASAASSSAAATPLIASPRRAKRRHAKFLDRRYAGHGVAGIVHREAEIIARH